MATTHDAYFTLDSQRSVTSIVVNDGSVISQERFPSRLTPQKWIEALREMDECVQQEKRKLQASCNQELQDMLGHTEDFAVENTSNNALCIDVGNQYSAAVQCFDQSQAPIAMTPSFGQGMQDMQDTRGLFGLDDGLALGGQASPSPCLGNISGINFVADGVTLDVQPTSPISSLFPSEAGRAQRTDHAPAIVENGLAKEKRAQKLKKTLEKLQGFTTLNKAIHNQRVDGIHDGPQMPLGCRELTLVRLAVALGRLSDVSVASGVVLGLLSWRLFGIEEERMVDEGMARNVAAKQMNQAMSQIFQRRGKTRDWASDGRKAAKMVFGALAGLTKVDKSFAFLLLSDVCSLDYLLKIAHFPILREAFQKEYSKIARSRSQEWQALHAAGYKTLDYDKILGMTGLAYKRTLDVDQAEQNGIVEEVGDGFISTLSAMHGNGSGSLWDDDFQTMIDFGTPAL
ncbi:uncharacterized protein LTR77_008286 [Saxophila tyrrhenica]|uniref:Uncharacterized protein n=1 Tax=Saxophila tyrrhenica TaxID=1690608 RepID=A0AAV9P0Z7_9PEZI|nr:hypothetical protein LTR77_008286 [Saxophila tyrrhenica]